MNFNREIRYIVVKLSEMEEALDPEEKRELANILEKIESHRIQKEKEPLECVVVESDWPMYENVWKQIESYTSLNSEDL